MKKAAVKTTQKNRWSKRAIKENLQMGILVLPAIILVTLFNYLPMFGIILPFKNYKATKGFFGSEWSDPLFRNFEFFFKSDVLGRIVKNTLVLNFMFIIGGLVGAVVVALLMFEVKKAAHVKIYQTIIILPSFLSWIAVSYMLYGLLEGDKGIINRMITTFGGEPIAWYMEPKYWPVILLICSMWKGVGYGSIIYYATLMGIDSALYEAARIDGANKLQETFHVSLPHLKDIVLLMLIMNCGGIFRADFGLFYNLTQNSNSLLPTTDVIDTYVYRALLEQGNIGMSSAVSLVQSVVCLVLLLSVNAIVKKFSPESSLF